MVITVTTPSARSLYPEHPDGWIQIGKLSLDQADALIRQYSITAILDASHPFATEISTAAITLAQQYNLPYLRYERRPSAAPYQPWQDRAERPGLVRLTDIKQVLCETYLAPQERTLLTLGRQWLPLFQPWQSRTTLFARVLPMSDAIAAAITAGFTRQRLIAIHPPIAPALEAALWQQWALTQVITKASGEPGGEATKQDIATQLGIRLVVIKRPPVNYPLQTHSLDTAIVFARNPAVTAEHLAASSDPVWKSAPQS
jgi:precorrin-6A/cobalt-precorrin-6A reductase